ncbi:MAG: hypothetical protein QOI34_909 [Verrucomicrobiota bacterium]
MSDETKMQDELEIAHVLFIDAVGYSKLSIDEQRELFDRLNHVVRTSAAFRASEAAGKLIRLPTGDGMALVFSEGPQGPVRCAVEISKAARNNPLLPLRMGIHSGPVRRVIDVNDRANAAGAGINIAQRVMSCGDSGHILLSKRTSDDLIEDRFWRPYLHDIGECEVKHGTKLGLVNFYNEEIGNSQLPGRCREGAHLRARKTRKILFLVFALAVVLALSAIFIWKANWGSKRRDNSIAVLPFKNLGKTEDEAHLTDGLHDEILTDLAKVADLKVVSRTSVMQYKTAADRNLREIARELGVAHIVEGSVQFVGNRVRVTAQLIDARTDTHLWAQKYDGDLADIFALESEVAEKIVAQLQSKLSPREKAAIDERPTSDLVAYKLYIRANSLIDQALVSGAKENLLEAIGLLEQAVARDPSFALAYYQMAHAHDQMYLRGFDHSPTRIAAAETAIRSVQRLRPDSGEAHLALAKHLYWGYLDYAHARQELILARRTLPNDPLPLLLLGYVDRRQGRWEESVSNMEHALQLDPRNPQNVFILQQMAKSQECLRHYPLMIATLKRAQALAPNDPVIRLQLARVPLDWKADPKPLRSSIETLISENPESAGIFASQWHLVAMCERDVNAASRALALLSADGCYDEAIVFPRGWCEGQVARLRGDSEGARHAFAEARAKLAQIVAAQSDNGPALCALGVLDAALGNKENAIREGRHSLELLPVGKDSINGALLIQYLALIYAWTGEKEAAIDQLDAATKIAGYLSYGQLRLDPVWDPLRGDPRFEKIVASLGPK